MAEEDGRAKRCKGGKVRVRYDWKWVGGKVWEGDGKEWMNKGKGERGKLKSFELNPTNRMKVMVKKRFSNFDQNRS